MKVNGSAESSLNAVAEIEPGKHGNRPVLKNGAQTRIALPMAYVESCAAKIEQDFLWRFSEAHDFANGNQVVLDEDGAPIGRYADHAASVDPDSYVHLEIQAYEWVRRYGLGREWAMRAEIFLRMMANRTQITVIDWGGYLTHSDDEKISLGGAQVSIRDLGLRLKDAYRDFFRWYRYVRECEMRGREPSGQEALYQLQREQMVAEHLQELRADYGFDDERE